MNNPRFIVRKATVADVSLIADLGARTFKTAFGAYNSQEDMEQYLGSHFSEKNIQSQLSNQTSTFLLGYQNDVTVGYAMLAAGNTPDSVTGPRPTELVRLYKGQSLIQL